MKLPLYRSYPLPDEPAALGRAHVEDALPRFCIRLADLATDPKVLSIDHSFAMVEWDIAFSRLDWITFRTHCFAEPDKVHVAPYILYPDSTSLLRNVWAHRTGNRWINYLDAECDYFGFGMIYFPLPVVQAFLSAPHHPHAAWFTDTNFSLWHFQNVGRVPVHWDVRPVHLHYEVA